MRKELSKKFKKIPQQAGVYLFKDNSGRILYVGKAMNLNKRARSHFSKTSNIFSQKFVDKAADIDWILTDDEKQALLLENELIKKYQPHYNIQWRDDKSYFWVNFTQEKWPRVEVTHQAGVLMRHSPAYKKKRLLNFLDGRHESLVNRGIIFCDSRFVGPLTDGRETKQVLRALRKIFPYRTCKNPHEKPCLQWHLGLCPAHGQELGIKNQESRRKKYLNTLNAFSQFLRLYAGEQIRIEAYDISNIHGAWATGSMIVFEGSKPKKSDYRRFKIKTVRGANDATMIKEVIRRRFKHTEWPLANLILIDGGKTQLNAARREIKKLGYSNIGLVALAKKEEEFYTEYSSEILKLSALPISLRLIFQAIRNEAHRFAIFYYRYLHGKEYRNRRNAKKFRTKGQKTP